MDNPTETFLVLKYGSMYKAFVAWFSEPPEAFTDDQNDVLFKYQEDNQLYLFP